MPSGIATGVLLAFAAINCIAAWRHIRRRCFGAARARALTSIAATLLVMPVALALALCTVMGRRGTEAKAVVLARSIAASMNVGLFRVPVLIASLVALAIAWRGVKRADSTKNEVSA
jgi:hypothetical protein